MVKNVTFQYLVKDFGVVKRYKCNKDKIKRKITDKCYINTTTSDFEMHMQFIEAVEGK